MKVFTTKSIAGMAVFSAISFIVYMIEIPIFASTPVSFLKLDLSNVFVMIAGFMYGPIPALIVSLIKELLHILIGTTGGVGEFANMIITTFYILIPSIVYTKKKGLKIVVITLVLACVVQSFISLLVNRFINFPFFLGSAPFLPTQASDEFFFKVWYYILIFNLIKSVVVSLITILVYKKTSYLFKKINLQNK